MSERIFRGVLLVVRLAGIWVGQRTFAGVSPEAFRRQVLDLLMLVAGLSVLGAIWALVA